MCCHLFLVSKIQGCYFFFNSYIFGATLDFHFIILKKTLVRLDMRERLHTYFSFWQVHNFIVFFGDKPIKITLNTHPHKE
jgi:hypothetical protein